MWNCKNNDLKKREQCNLGYQTCMVCEKAIWDNMKQEGRDYDNRVDPQGAYHTDFTHYVESEEERGCSCHINPPCSYCVNKNSEDEE